MNKPSNYESVQDYLIAQGFTINDGHFVKGAVIILAEDIIGHTPNTFAHKAREHGWVAAVEMISNEVKPLFADVIWSTD